MVYKVPNRLDILLTECNNNEFPLREAVTLDQFLSRPLGDELFNICKLENTKGIK